jgi:hypothetical protein
MTCGVFGVHKHRECVPTSSFSLTSRTAWVHYCDLMQKRPRDSAKKAAALLGRLGGKVTSEAKTRTARQNGMRGGRNSELREQRLAWFEKMATYPLTAEQRADLKRWEAEHLDGRTVGTSDWPGWGPLIGNLPMGRKPKGRVEQGASAPPSEPHEQSSPAVPPASRGTAKTIAQPGSIAWMRMKRKPW